MKGDHNVTKYDSVEKFVEGHLHALKRMGVSPERQIVLPEKPDDPGAMDEVYAKLGRPDDPKGYELKLGDGATEEDRQFAEGFREVAHKAGLSQAQMGAAIEYLNGVTGKAIEDAATAEAAAATACRAEVTSEWGEKTKIYDVEIPKLIEELGGKDAVEKLNADGLGSSATLLKVLAKVSDMRAEPGKLPGGDAPGGQNRAMTPAEAQSTLNARNADKEWGAALRQKNHPRHADVLAERQRLLAFINPAPAG